MTTILLPFASLEESVSCFDNTTLEEQYYLANTILGLLHSQENLDEKYVKMWIGFEDCLKKFSNLCIECLTFRKKRFHLITHYVIPEKVITPWYIGWGPYHESCKAYLKRTVLLYYDHTDVNPYFLQRDIEWPTDQMK